MDNNKQWYVNTVTGQIAQGKLWPDTQRLGPYATRDDAANAWTIIEKRNKAWDEDDKQWRQWYDDVNSDSN